MTLNELTDDEFARFLALIYRASGIRIAETKRVLVSNRVRRRLRATGIETFAAYYAFLTSPSGAGEMPAFLDAVTTNETYFFRDQAHYDWLGDEFIPHLLAEAAARRRPRGLRIWSAACSTGEEPYSIAIKLADRRAELLGWRLSVHRPQRLGPRRRQGRRLRGARPPAGRRRDPLEAVRPRRRRPALDRQGRRPRARLFPVAQPDEAARRRAVRLRLPQERAHLF